MDTLEKMNTLGKEINEVLHIMNAANVLTALICEMNELDINDSSAADWSALAKKANLSADSFSAVDSDFGRNAAGTARDLAAAFQIVADMHADGITDAENNVLFDKLCNVLSRALAGVALLDAPPAEQRH